MATITLLTDTDDGATSMGIINTNFTNINSSLTSTAVENEVISGSGTAFTLASTPIAGSVKVYALGQRLKVGASYDYTISGATITTTNSWTTGDLIADYRV